MSWYRARSARWMLAALGLLSTSCVGAIGAGAVLVVAGAGALAYTCYDRVSVTVTDRLTGTKLCDAKVTFLQGESATEATSCYQAALSKGKYTLRVERPGLQTFEEPIEVVRGENCGQSVQTMVVALDRANRVEPPQRIAPAPAMPVARPVATDAVPAPMPPPAAPASAAAPPAVPSPASSQASPAPVAPPSSSPTPSAPSATGGAPASGSFPQ